MSAKGLEAIDRKLTLIVRMVTQLLLTSQLPDDALQRDQVALLDSLGLNANEIADVVATSPSSVRKTLSRLRKQTK